MSRRRAIEMTPDEVLAFLAEERVLTCASVGRDGHPHLMPLWYVLRGSTLWAWTYARSQKVRNLERNPLSTVQVEAGGDIYAQLRGVMLKTEAVIHRDTETVLGVGMELSARYSPEPDDAALDAARAQAAKRVALEFRERSRATWDHRKLAGGY